MKPAELASRVHIYYNKEDRPENSNLMVCRVICETPVFATKKRTRNKVQ